MSLWKQIESRVAWDFRVGDEFKRGQDGKFAFVLDIYEGEPKVALYKIKKYSCESNTIKQQPPSEMLLSAAKKEGADRVRHGIFNIDGEIEAWIRKNYFECGD
ncbi:MAG: hypothetical protein JL50_02730 [Peptococcaceae bacterium BICA1-7]|nr:MAG: hypothetical protein JL50_02730 [Peptococcaceae bacterium BICA1-7]HBV97821.1 hypothetical protein [Desulfotomaculum sp.]